jgi:hypothetical protein
MLIPVAVDLGAGFALYGGQKQKKLLNLKHGKTKRRHTKRHKQTFL